jgi:thioredoxin reductase (NADPH)
MNETHVTDVAIIGAGPVGLFAIFELGMLNIKCHVIDALDSVGGQCAALYPEKPIYDIPAHPAIDGLALVQQLEKQAAPFAPVYHLNQQVIGLEKAGEAFTLTTSTGTIITCKAVIIAAGCGAFGPNRPPLDGLAAYEASGDVRYMVTRKEQFRDKRVVIAGGGDSAVDWAVALADVASHIDVVHRRDKFRAAPEMVSQMQVLAASGKINMVVPYQLDGLEGENGRLSGVRVSTLDGESKILKADYLLPFYGLAMELGPIANWGLGLEHNHISVQVGTCETSVKGIFAIGDIATYPHKLKLILCGFSEAAMSAHAIRSIIYPDTAYHFEYSTTKGVQSAA